MAGGNAVRSRMTGVPSARVRSCSTGRSSPSCARSSGPTQQQLVTYFLVVMVFVIFMMALVSGLDLVIGKAVFWLFNGQPKG